MYKKRLSIFLVILLLLNLGLSRRAGQSYVFVTNTATLSYTNAAQVYYYTSSDSIQIQVFAGPTMKITKTTKNLRTGEEGSNTQTISVVPGDTAEITLFSQNTGDTAAYWVTVIDTFPAGVGDPAGNSMSYVPGSETCAINGSLPADSISWCVDEAHTWNAWQTYNDTVSKSIPNTCTGIRWRWNRVVSNTENETQSWIRIKFKWIRNGNQ